LEQTNSLPEYVTLFRKARASLLVDVPSDPGTDTPGIR